MNHSVHSWYSDLESWCNYFMKNIIFASCLQIFPLQEKIENINDQYWTLRAEEVRPSSFSLLLSCHSLLSCPCPFLLSCFDPLHGYFFVLLLICFSNSLGKYLGHLYPFLLKSKFLKYFHYRYKSALNVKKYLSWWPRDVFEHSSNSFPH